MKDKTPDELFAEALKIHQQGDLAQAKNLYETILARTQHADTLHALGILHAQIKDYLTSENYIKQALQLNPNNPVFYNNLGNALKNLKKFLEAIQQFEQALHLNPNYAEAHSNLAGLYYQLDDLPKANEHVQEALRLNPDYLEAQINQGLLLIKQHEFNTALKIFENILIKNPHVMLAHYHLANLYLRLDDSQKAIQHYAVFLQHNPNHPEAWNNYGAALLKQKQTNDAINAFNKVIEIEPKHLFARRNLATALLQQDRFTEAAWHYQLCLQLDSNDSETQYNFAVATMALGNIPDAIQHFLKTLSLDPNHINAHCNLAALYSRTGKKDKAIEHYQIALQLKPDYPDIAYMLDALTGKKLPKAAPNEYVKNLFDSYAGYFDKQLTEELHYQTPKLMRKILQKYFPLEKVHWNILDLGCGTGLSGDAFRDIAAHLVGVDLSEKMLEKAREKNIYDELIPGDIVTVLTQINQVYNLIISADTLVYFGDLTAVFKHCHQALLPEGFFLFSLEQGSEKDYQLQTTGRYAHTKTYIERLCQETGFKILTCETIISRYQAGEEVNSWVFLLGN